MGRHEWGAIHLLLSFIFIVLLIFHIIFHWKMIVVMYRKLIGSGTMRLIIGLIFIIVCLLLILFPFFMKPAIRESGNKWKKLEKESIYPDFEKGKKKVSERLSRDEQKYMK